jgi:L-alanine-DL-glutamate epimerase-like enolase superfamily enzyme
MPKIVSVEVCVARVPLDKPINFSTRQVTAREYCLVRVRAEDGTAGLGYCYAVNKAGRLLFDAVVDGLSHKVVGQDSHRVEGIWQDMYQETLLLGRVGGVMRALSAIDIAIWDLNARLAGLPLYRYLGASVLDRVPSYGSGGYYWPGKGDQELGDELRAFVEAGHRAVKIKVGARGRSPAQEAARLKAARDAVGPDIELMLDANNAWPDLPTALQYIRRFEPMDPYWIEEPFLPDDIDNHAALARATPIPIATGEIEAGRWRFKELLEKRAAAILQTDATVCGGITEWRRITAMASCFGVATSPHAWHDVHVHLGASAPSVSYVEFMPDDHVVNFRRLIDTQLVLEKGDLLLPKGPGLGFDFDPEAIARYGAKDIGGEGLWHVLR